jgi:hypothetical protein
VKERALRMIVDHRQDNPSDTALGRGRGRQAEHRSGDGTSLAGPGRHQRWVPSRHHLR